jgi:hypothetical protein
MQQQPQQQQSETDGGCEPCRLCGVKDWLDRTGTCHCCSKERGDDE